MIDLAICVGSACHIHGGTEMITLFQQGLKELELTEYVQLKGAFCQNNCQHAVCVSVGNRQYKQLTKDDVYPLLKRLKEELQWNT